MTETPQPPQPQPQPPPPAAPGAPQAPQAPAVRPGGLTALAVLNFVFGGLAVIGLIGMFTLLGIANKIASDATGGEVTLTKVPGIGMVWLGIILMILVIALLIVSGVGYIGQKKVMGYGIGCAYGVVGVVNAIIGAVTSGFGFMVVIWLIYPVLTLILLNTIFKKCFVN